MTKKIALLLTHGMGDITRLDFEGRVNRLEQDLQKRIGDLHPHVLFQPIYFQDILQENQIALFREIKRTTEIDWIKLRKFMLYSFSDAASLEHRAQEADSVYLETQKRIYDALVAAYGQLQDGDKNVIAVAQSLGCQVLSNYIWDSQVSNPKQGIWSNNEHVNPGADANLDAFVRFKDLRTLFTTGCNIPLFVAGRNRIQSIKTNSDGYAFEWHNFYDQDDVLGWPLKPMGVRFNPGDDNPGISYADAVTEDHEINANATWFSYVTKSWNPLSHGEYWQDSTFLDVLTQKIYAALN